MKLHRMPLLIKRMIIEELGFDERLLLSFTSKRTCGLLGLFRTDLEAMSIEISINDSEIFLGVPKPSYDLSELFSATRYNYSINNYWNFIIPFYQRHMKYYSVWKIDGSTVQVERVYFSSMDCILNDERFDITRNAVTLFGKLLKHIESVLNIENRQCKIDVHMSLPVGIISQLDCNNSYEKINIRAVHLSYVIPEELTLLLEHIKTKQLCLDVKVSSVPGYKFQNNPERKNSIYWLEIRNHSWVDLSELPAAKFITIVKKIQLGEMNTVLKSWTAGRNPEMEIGYFEIDELTDRDRETIFTDIVTHATQLTGAEIESFFDSTENLPNRRYVSTAVAVDILRESDEMRATVIEGPICLYPETCQKMFIVVWSEKNLRTIGRANN